MKRTFYSRSAASTEYFLHARRGAGRGHVVRWVDGTGRIRSPQTSSPRGRARPCPPARERRTCADGASRRARADAGLALRTPPLLGNGAGLPAGDLRRNRPHLRSARPRRACRRALRRGKGGPDRRCGARRRCRRGATPLRPAVARRRIRARGLRDGGRPRARAHRATDEPSGRPAAAGRGAVRARCRLRCRRYRRRRGCRRSRGGVRARTTGARARRPRSGDDRRGRSASRPGVLDARSEDRRAAARRHAASPCAPAVRSPPSGRRA